MSVSDIAFQGALRSVTFGTYAYDDAAAASRATTSRRSSLNPAQRRRHPSGLRRSAQPLRDASVADRRRIATGFGGPGRRSPTNSGLRPVICVSGHHRRCACALGGARAAADHDAFAAPATSSSSSRPLVRGQPDARARRARVARHLRARGARASPRWCRICTRLEGLRAHRTCACATSRADGRRRTRRFGRVERRQRALTRFFTRPIGGAIQFVPPLSTTPEEIGVLMRSKPSCRRGYLRRIEARLAAMRRTTAPARSTVAAAWRHHDFSSNDYLALSGSQVVTAFRRAKRVGSGGARLLGGRRREHSLLRRVGDVALRTMRDLLVGLSGRARRVSVLSSVVDGSPRPPQPRLADRRHSRDQLPRTTPARRTAHSDASRPCT